MIFILVGLGLNWAFDFIDVYQRIVGEPSEVEQRLNHRLSLYGFFASPLSGKPLQLSFVSLSEQNGGAVKDVNIYIYEELDDTRVRLYASRSYPFIQGAKTVEIFGETYAQRMITCHENSAVDKDGTIYEIIHWQKGIHDQFEKSAPSEPAWSSARNPCAREFETRLVGVDSKALAIDRFEFSLPLQKPVFSANEPIELEALLNGKAVPAPYSCRWTFHEHYGVQLRYIGDSKCKAILTIAAGSMYDRKVKRDGELIETLFITLIDATYQKVAIKEVPITIVKDTSRSSE
jgi:hypothetical protein